MSNVMSLKSVRNKPHRDGFDLSKRNLFTAKIGELLPVYCKEILPGDKFKINQRWFTRTRPVNTAAYTRIREYYDWFFVPTQLMWNKFNTFVSQTVDNPFHAQSLYASQYVGDTHPYMTAEGVCGALSVIGSDSDGETNPYKSNLFGYNRAELGIKLLHYLGYGDYTNYEDINLPTNTAYRENVAMNPFPLLAYQKIYQDYYRNSQWEKASPWTCNVDYMYLANKSQDAAYMEMLVQEISGEYESMFDMRYANWHKDYFTGLLPSAQFGDAASVDLSSLLNISPLKGVILRSELPAGDAVFSESITDEGFQSFLLNNNSIAPSPLVGFSKSAMTEFSRALGLTTEKLSSVFTILALRQAEAMQKWKEVTMSSQQDYKSQMEAHFGVSLSNAYSERSRFIDGFVNNIDINEVVNTNLADASVEANIAGKGASAGDGFVSFDAKEHGYLMCIYHAVPLLDYSLTGVRRQNLKTNVLDYAIPEFDQTGMIQVPLVELSNSFDVGNPYAGSPELLGYAPRYVDYKTDIDEVHGSFYNGGDESWVAPIDDSYIKQYMETPRGTAISLDYKWFKIPPSVVDSIFGVDADSSNSTDHLLVNCGFDVKAVRNLDYNGLPY